MPRRPEPELMDQEEEARAYAHADFSDVNQRFVNRVLEIFPTDGPANVVDLGCGPADIPIRLLKERPHWTLTAVDGSLAMLALAKGNLEREALRGRIQLVLGDALDSGVLARSFDLVISNSILHHVLDPLAFWREVRRIGKPGATVFLRDLFRPESESAARAIVEQYAANESPLLQEEFFRSLLAAYTPREARKQLQKAGLDHLTVEIVSDRHLDIIGVLP